MCFRCDGGVTNSEFVMQLLADLTGRRLATNEYEDMSALGAAYLAGLHMGGHTSTRIHGVRFLTNGDKISTLVS